VTLRDPVVTVGPGQMWVEPQWSRQVEEKAMDATQIVSPVSLIDPGRALPGRHRLVSSNGHTLSARGIPAPLLLVAGNFSNQAGAALATTMFAGAGAVGTAGLRLAFAGVMLLIWRRPRLRMAWRTALLIGLFGFVIACANLAFYAAVDRLPLGEAVTIEFLGPLVLALLNCRRRTHLLSVLLAAGGVVLICWMGGPINWAGVVYALAAGAGWACYVVLSVRVGQELPGLSGLALGIAVGGLCALPFGLAQMGMSMVRLPTLVLGASVALMSTTVPYSLEFKALQRVPPRVYGVFASLEPALAAIAGTLLLNQWLEPTQWVGLLAVVWASIAISMS
jgi:inner membrane transporter RhtA